jgi:membrane-bound lytic murein transglycosylase C
MEAQWKRREQEIEARWQQRKREIEQKWDQALRSTPTSWVDYSSDDEARSVVDFENGTVEVTALVPVGETGSWPATPAAVAALASGPASSSRALAVPVSLRPEVAGVPQPLVLAALPAAWAKMLHQFEQVFSQEATSGQPVLANQVVSRAGQPVDKQTVKAYVQNEVLPGSVVGEKPVQSRDGVARIQVTARVKMAPDHVKKRAQQYQDVVPAYAKQHGLDPRLLYAIIHTESFFNPKAQSPLPTYGLMQLVPRGAARDAYNFLYKDDRVLDDEYLLDPAHNVELGAAYLRLLRKQLFATLDDGDKKNYLLVCAFKWGPENTQSKILRQVRVQDLTDTQIFSLLTQRTPEETSAYLKQVRDRMQLYGDQAP